jgi:hypothetical protein
MASIKSNRAIWLMGLLLVGRLSGHAGSLRKIWEVDVRKIVQGIPSPNVASFPLQLLKFSPDGQQLAVAVAWDLSPKVFKSQLLVIQTQHPTQAAKQFEISAAVASEGLPSATLFGWSPDGKTLFAAGKVIHLQNGATCEPPRPSAPPFWPSALLGDDLLIQGGPDSPDGPAVRAWMDAIRESLKNNGNRPPSSFPPAPPEVRSHFKFFDSECKPQGQWEVTEAWQIHDVSIERGLVAMTRKLGFNTYTFLTVDPIARKIIRRWSADNGNMGSFADGGKVMCRGGDVIGKGKAPSICWDVDTGNKIGQPPTINGGDPMVTAAHSSRIVASSNRRVRRPFFSDNVGTVVDRQVVWDFRSGEELVSWRPKSQSYIDVNNERVEEPFQFTISPDGEYIAEGGNGIVRLYKIEP